MIISYVIWWRQCLTSNFYCQVARSTAGVALSRRAVSIYIRTSIHTIPPKSPRQSAEQACREHVHTNVDTPHPTPVPTPVSVASVSCTKTWYSREKTLKNTQLPPDLQSQKRAFTARPSHQQRWRFTRLTREWSNKDIYRECLYARQSYISASGAARLLSLVVQSHECGGISVNDSHTGCKLRLPF